MLYTESMQEHIQPHYLPHRRQRPLSDTQFEIHTLFASGSSGSKLPSKLILSVAGVVLAMSAAIFSSLGLMELLSPNNPQVAGAITYVDDGPVATATPKPVVVCWNQVAKLDDGYFWQDSCRGLPPSSRRSCVPGKFLLTQWEYEEYLLWYYGNQVLDLGCREG